MTDGSTFHKIVLPCETLYKTGHRGTRTPQAQGQGALPSQRAAESVQGAPEGNCPTPGASLNIHHLPVLLFGMEDFRGFFCPVFQIFQVIMFI